MALTEGVSWGFFLTLSSLGAPSIRQAAGAGTRLLRSYGWGRTVYRGGDVQSRWGRDELHVVSNKSVGCRYADRDSPTNAFFGVHCMPFAATGRPLLTPWLADARPIYDEQP